MEVLLLDSPMLFLKEGCYSRAYLGTDQVDLWNFRALAEFKETIPEVYFTNERDTLMFLQLP